jgi:hypothetical protein
VTSVVIAVIRNHLRQDLRSSMSEAPFDYGQQTTLASAQHACAWVIA